MRLLKKGLAITVIALLVFTGLVPALHVNALDNFKLTIGFAEGFDAEQGHVEYSMDASTWETVSANSEINIEHADSLILKVVPAEGYEVDFDAGKAPYLSDGGPGIAFEAGGQEDNRAKLVGDGIEATLTSAHDVSLTGITFKEAPPVGEGTVSIDITGPGLEYWNDDIPSRITFFINSPQPGDGIIMMGKDNIEFKGDYTIKDQFVQEATGVKTINPVPIEYDYDGSGKVSVVVKISNASTKITSFKVNGEEFADQCPQTDEEFLDTLDGPRSVAYSITNVPYAAHYDVVIEAEFDDLMGGFGWNYLPEEDQSGDSREDCIAHGTLSFVKGEYNGMVFESAIDWNSYRHNGVSQIFEWTNGDKNYTDEHDAWGSAAFPRGAVITFKLIPDEGYQLTSLFGDKDLEPQEEVGVYKITMTGGMNSHLMATFTEIGNVVNATAGAVKDGEVSNLKNTYGEGTMKLNVEDTEISEESKKGFEGKAKEEEATIEEYIDINLANTVYKATEDSSDAWDRAVENLEEPATIKLELEKSYTGKDLVVIHENGDQYETIPVQFDGDKTISFETSSFSNYALASVEPEEEPTDPEDPETPDDPAEPGSGDEHYVLKSGDNSLEFDDRKDMDYSVVILDTNSITDEQLAAMDATRAEMEEAVSQIKSAVPKEFLNMYVVMILDNKTGEEVWGRQNLVLKLKKTGDMDGYENFRLIDVTHLGEDSYTGEEIKGTEEDGYLVFKLSEVGQFALIADKIEEPAADDSAPAEEKSDSSSKSGSSKKAPNTGDENNIILWVVVAAVAAVSAGVAVYKMKKRQ